MAKLCMGCMNLLPEGSDSCTICGFSASATNPDHCLPLGTVLQDNYIVGRVLHEGSDSIVYIGYDRMLKEPRFIQEYYPAALCERGTNNMVMPLGGCDRPFQEYREVFRRTMRSLAHMKDLPNIIPVYDLFEQNGTVYTASDYRSGVTLTKKIKQAGGRLTWSEARPLFMSLMTSVTQLHAAGIRHLAINPDNILISADGKAHLRNFAIEQARTVGTDLNPELATGYAAPEQYDMSGRTTLSDATDVYALAATIFYAVTGNVPPAGNKRAKDSDDLFMSADVAQELTQEVCVALFNALQVDPELRTATVAELHAQLSTEPNVAAIIAEAKEDCEPDDEDEPHAGRKLLVIFISVAAALLVVGGIVLFALLGGNNEQPSESVGEMPTLPTTTTTTEAKTQYATPNLVGRSYYDLRDSDELADYKLVVSAMQYNSKAKGQVIEQKPAYGSPIDKGDTITVIISAGKNDEVNVPDVAGWKQEHAQLYLEALGFKVEIATVMVSDYEKGIVDSTDPRAGTTKRVGDTITLRVSNVQPTTTAPTTTPTNTVPDVSDPASDPVSDLADE